MDASRDDSNSDNSNDFSHLTLREDKSVEEGLKLSNNSSTLEDSGYSSSLQDSAPRRRNSRTSRSQKKILNSQDLFYLSSIVPEHVSSRTCEEQKYIDIIAKLGKYPIVLEKILSQLAPDDLVRCCFVSKMWNYIFKYNSKAFKRRKEYLSQPGLRNKENMGMPDECSSSEKQPTYVRISQTSTPLASITASRQINFCSTPVTPLPALAPALPRTDRFKRYWEEGKKLTAGKTLMPCPRCSLPSRVDKDINIGQCSESKCRFQFCLTCLSAQHITTVCPAKRLNMNHPTWPSSLKSRSCRRNLRRY